MQAAAALEQVVGRYLEAKRRVVAQGFGHDLDWQAGCSLDSVTEQDFLREAAWVVLSAGLSETTVRNLFDKISQCFLNWRSADAITRNREVCVRNALLVFGHSKKIAAIAEIACVVSSRGFAKFKCGLRDDCIGVLRKLPYIGPVTVFHLAKNLGLDVAKPDRHLVRIAQAAGACSPQDLCTAISATVGDRIGVVDLVLWRFATIERTYEGHFASGASQ